MPILDQAYPADYIPRIYSVEVEVEAYLNFYCYPVDLLGYSDCIFDSERGAINNTD